MCTEVVDVPLYCDSNQKLAKNKRNLESALGLQPYLLSPIVVQGSSNLGIFNACMVEVQNVS